MLYFSRFFSERRKRRSLILTILISNEQENRTTFFRRPNFWQCPNDDADTNQINKHLLQWFTVGNSPKDNCSNTLTGVLIGGAIEWKIPGTRIPISVLEENSYIEDPFIVFGYNTQHVFVFENLSYKHLWKGVYDECNCFCLPFFALVPDCLIGLVKKRGFVFSQEFSQKKFSNNCDRLNVSWSCIKSPIIGWMFRTVYAHQNPD